MQKSIFTSEIDKAKRREKATNLMIPSKRIMIVLYILQIFFLTITFTFAILSDSRNNQTFSILFDISSIVMIFIFVIGFIKAKQRREAIKKIKNPPT